LIADDARAAILAGDSVLLQPWHNDGLEKEEQNVISLRLRYYGKVATQHEINFE